MLTKLPTEKAIYRRGVLFPEIELLQARYTRQTFAPHFHDCLAIGVVEAGALTNAYRSRFLRPVGAGEVILIEPGEVHTGRAIIEMGVAYRMLYIPIDLLEKLNQGHELHYDQARISGQAYPFLAARLVQLHCRLQEPGASRLELESLISEVAAGSGLTGQDAFPGHITPGLHRQIRGTNRPVEPARVFLCENFTEEIGLNRLADLACTSPFHFLRLFERQVGLPPHAYQAQLRIEHAKALIKQSMSLAEVALQSGFFDQSHFQRVFKKLVGVTPGQFRDQK